MGMYWSYTFLLDRRPMLMAQVTWTGAGACLLAYALLIPRFELWGAVAATLIGFALMAAFALWRSQRFRPFPYEYSRWVKITACAMMAALPSVLLRPTGFWYQAALGSACMALFVMLLFACDSRPRGNANP